MGSHWNINIYINGDKQHETYLFSLSGRIQLWGHAIAVDWAEPEVEVDEDTMATVKILYIRNLMLQTTEETIEKEFNSLKPGTNTQSNNQLLKLQYQSFLEFGTLLWWISDLQ